MTDQEIESLRASEEKYRKMIERASDAIFSIDTRDATVVGANPKAEQLTGCGLEELVGLKVWQLHPESERIAAEALFEKVRHKGSGVSSELNLLRKGGGLVPIDVSASVIEYGRSRVIQRICRDITERTAREAQLQHHREFEDLVMAISASFISIEAQRIDEALQSALGRVGKFAQVSRAYIYLLGAGCDIETGRCHSDLYAWGDTDVPVFDEPTKVELKDFWWALDRLRKGETVVWDVTESRQAMSAPQTEVDRSSVCVPMFAAGELVGFIGFDVVGEKRVWHEDTLKILRMVGFVFGSALERKRALESIEQSKRELERLLEQRSRELEQKQAQLLQSEKMASLAQLVAGVAHEMNTPLGVLSSNAGTLANSVQRLQTMVDRPSEESPEQYRSHLRRVLKAVGSMSEVNQRAVERIDKILRTMRNFARLDRAEVGLVDLNEGLRNVLVLLGPEFANRIAVENEFGVLPRVRCRPDVINQVFMNLLVNASEAIDETGTIRVKTYRDAGRVVVEIRDTGRGIDDQDLSRIFDPGYTKKGVGVGMGLGLSIVHQVMKEHGGDIEVESQVGQGSLFRLNFPASITAEHTVAPSS